MKNVTSGVSVHDPSGEVLVYNSGMSVVYNKGGDSYLDVRPA